jgi:glycosyltransferase involved in cell wall biosynthesis
MRLVFDGRIVLPRMTGAGRYVVEVARRLPALDGSLDLVVLLHPSVRRTDVPTTLSRAGATVEYVDLRVASWRQWIQIPQVLGRLKPSLYHYPFLDLPFTRFPSVATVYDLNPILDRAYFAGPAAVAKRALARGIIGSTLRRSRAVLAISDATRHLIAQHYPRWAGKVRTTLLGVDPGGWSGTAAPGSAPAVADKWAGRAYYLYVGVDRPHKNLVRLVGAFARFRGALGWAPGSGPYLWLAGVGQGTRELQAQVATRDLAADVRNSGALADSALGNAYRGAVAFAYVSTSEGFGLPILEAFAAEVPVIAASASSLPEVAGDGAIYADPHSEAEIAEAFGRVWGDEQLRRNLVERGGRRMLALSWDNTAKTTLKAYYDVLAGPGSTSPG